MKQPDFIKALRPENRQHFDQVTRLVSQEEILKEHDVCNHILFLLSGEIEVYKLSANGKAFRLYTILEGESCVLNLSCVLSDLHYSAYARTLTEVQCILIPRKVFLDVFNQEEALRRYVFALISTRLIQITAKVEGIVLDTTEDRLKDFLYRSGKEVLYITHEEIAEEVGTAREVVSRHLKKWEREGRLELYRGKIRLKDIEK